MDALLPRLRVIEDDIMWDPRTWAPDDHEHRIYADETLTTYAIVDAIDYPWAVQWRWNVLRMHGGTRKPKLYMRRALNEYSNGVRLRVTTVLLHVEIMKRTGIEPPSAEHTIVDHVNGDSLLCRRANLRWATPKQNYVGKRAK